MIKKIITLIFIVILSLNISACSSDKLSNNVGNENKGANKNITLDYFIGRYKGVNPYYVTDWSTYEMVEDADNSKMTITKVDDIYYLTDIMFDSEPYDVHTALDDVSFTKEDFSYYEDSDVGNSDMWDCLKAENDRGVYNFCMRQRDNQIFIDMILDHHGISFIPKD